jgi:2'-5' RNA ligase
MGTFDARAAGEVEKIKRKLLAGGFQPDAYEPHVTFGIYSGVDDASLLGWIEPIAARRHAFTLNFDHIGFFPGAPYCFLAPSASRALIALHAKIHERFDHCCTDKDCLYSLSRNNWTPHMTLASAAPAQAGVLLSILWESFVPFKADLTHLKVTSTAPDRNLGVFALKK